MTQAIPGRSASARFTRGIHSKVMRQCHMGTASTGMPLLAHRNLDQIDSCPERGVYI